MVSQLSDSIYDTNAEQFDRDDHEARPLGLLWVLITSGEHESLERHLEETVDKFDVTKIFNSSGFTPLHLAAYKS